MGVAAESARQTGRASWLPRTHASEREGLLVSIFYYEKMFRFFSPPRALTGAAPVATTRRARCREWLPLIPPEA